MTECETDVVHIRLELEGELASKFYFVKEKIGLKNTTEVVRYLVTEAANREKKEDFLSRV